MRTLTGLLLSLSFLSLPATATDGTRSICTEAFTASTPIELGDELESPQGHRLLVLDSLGSGRFRVREGAQEWLLQFEPRETRPAPIEGSRALRGLIAERIRSGEWDRISPFIQMETPLIPLQFMPNRHLAGSISEIGVRASHALPPRQAIRFLSNNDLIARIYLAIDLLHATLWLSSEGLMLTGLDYEDVILMGSGPAGAATLARGRYVFAIGKPEVMSTTSNPDVGRATMALFVGRVLLNSMFENVQDADLRALQARVDLLFDDELIRLEQSSTSATVERRILLNHLRTALQGLLRADPSERFTRVKPLTDIDGSERMRAARLHQRTRTRRFEQTLNR